MNTKKPDLSTSERDELFALCCSIKTICQRECGNCDVSSGDERLELLVLLYNRCVEHYFGVVVTAFDDLRSPSRVAARSLLETSFYFRAIHNGNFAPAELAKQHNKWRQDHLKNISRSSIEIFEALAISDAQQREIASMDAKYYSAKTMAQLAGAYDEYLIWYSLFSMTVHVGKFDLREQFGSAKGVPTIPFGPMDISAVAFSGNLILDLTDTLAHEFGRDITADVKYLSELLVPFNNLWAASIIE